MGAIVTLCGCGRGGVRFSTFHPPPMGSNNACDRGTRGSLNPIFHFFIPVRRKTYPLLYYRYMPPKTATKESLQKKVKELERSLESERAGRLNLRALIDDTRFTTETPTQTSPRSQHFTTVTYPGVSEVDTRNYHDCLLSSRHLSVVQIHALNTFSTEAPRIRTPTTPDQLYTDFMDNMEII